MASGDGGDDAGVKRVADRYLKREVLGEGTYGVVFKAVDTKTGNTVAIKKIRLGKYKEGVNFTALREIKLLKELKDSNIIELIDAFPYKGNLHLVFEFMETDLEAVIRDRNIVLSPADTKSYIQMMLKGLAFCHKKWVLHSLSLLTLVWRAYLGVQSGTSLIRSLHDGTEHQNYYLAPSSMDLQLIFGLLVVFLLNCCLGDRFSRVLVTLINLGRSLLHLELQSLLNGRTWFIFQIMLNTNLSLHLHFAHCFQWPVMMHWIFYQECLHMIQKQELQLSRL
ncbi:Os05g0392300 [Oryza sativa Japonica Group]|uniref:[RNA-polymerase]-subunit kinase n=1 Tax=Oryza sativa subsp. japonica TaxID=39947 RepID=B7F5K0_ORYSJ|nr:putative cell division protein kinase [Oryza sativa Japonica Group]KAB8099297.1 hypothetical protein EE612_029292 [Oryza sativa]BAG99897.1 unnamed protein product [Oryza sativa Japonica Group]BAS93858.1 Os05g0392300 [Oryza sativa Japonica Group]